MAYSIEQLRQARQNALAAGDTTAAEKLLRFAQRQAMAEAAPESFNPTDDMGTGERLRAGIGQGMTNVARHAGNLVGMVSDDDLAAAKERDQALLDTGAGRVGSLIGETAATALPIAGTTMGIARAGKLGANLVGGAIRRGAVEGAAQGALMADPGERGSGALLGGALGGILPGIGAAGGKVMRGIKRTPEAQRLIDEGVDLTPGQMRPGSAISAIEESWQSVPIVGGLISSARQNANATLQRRAIAEGAAPGAVIAQGEADDMLESAYKSFEPLYDQAKGFPVFGKIVQTSGGDIPLSVAFSNAVKSRGVRANDADRKAVGGWLNNEITALRLAAQKKGTTDSSDLLKLRSTIRAEARKARMQNEAAQADLLDAAETQVTRSLESQLPKQALDALRTADSKYGTYKILEDAVARAKDKPGGFNANDLSAAVAASVGRGTQKGSYARGGGGALRDLAQAGKASLQTTSPATGARLAAIGIPLAAGAQMGPGSIPVAAGLLGLSTTRTGRKLAAGTTSGQKALQRIYGRGIGQLDPTTRALLEQYANRASVGGLGYLALQE